LHDAVLGSYSMMSPGMECKDAPETRFMTSPETRFMTSPETRCKDAPETRFGIILHQRLDKICNKTTLPKNYIYT